MPKTVSRLLPALLAALSLVPAAAHAEGRAVLEISGANFKPLPLAIAPFGGPVAGAEAVRTTLHDDLAISGLFELLDPKSFLADPKVEGMTASTIDFSKWTAVGADSVVKGTVVGDDKSGWKVELRLFDAMGQKEALKGSYAGKTPELRTFAHDFANLLYRHFTGENGVFRTRLAYAKKVPGGKELFTADFDGKNSAPLTSGGQLNLLPGWSPDGRQLVITSYRGGAPMLYVVDVATKVVKALPARGELQTGAAFSPDGKRIAFTMSENGNSDIYVMNTDGTGLKNLSDSREIESSPTWSPDGKRLAFVSKRSGDPQIFVMNADGTGVERLTFQGKYNQTPDWSPRGDVIAFTARDERNVFDLFTVDVASKQIRRLTQDQGNNEEPSFSPNGRNLAFTSTREGGRQKLFLMNADGTNQRGLGLEDVSTPSWGPGSD